MTQSLSQKVSLNILKSTTDICEKLDLRYFLIYGSLIGAVRHQGFIPWDDDVDIMMPREDYNRLIKYCNKNKKELKGLEIFTPIHGQQNYPYMITRISNPNYKIEIKNETSYGMGIFIDIYPFDGLGNDLRKALQIEKKGDKISSLYYLSTRKHYSKENTKGIVKNIIKFPAFIFSKLIGKSYFQNKLFELANTEFDHSKYVGCATWASGGIKDIFEREWFEKYIYLNFENYKFRVPYCYDKVLTHIYGDYMKLPSKKDQIGHHFYTLKGKKYDH